MGHAALAMNDRATRVSRGNLPKAVGAPHHITQISNNRQDVFLLDSDCETCLALPPDHSRQYGLSVIGYCLRTNHVDLVGVPESPNCLPCALRVFEGGVPRAQRMESGGCGLGPLTCVRGSVGW